MRNKSFDLETIALKLDISPNMHKYAVDRYEGIAKYLKSKGIIAKFYPQGSFRTGTVVRPLKDGVESNYDIDEICELYISKEDANPAEVKKCIGNALLESDEYSKKMLPEEDRCWTLEYAEVIDGVGLMLDIVPAIHESQSAVSNLVLKNVPYEYAQAAIVITDRESSDNYRWLQSNPDGYGSWFDNINRRFLEDNLEEKKKSYLNRNKTLFKANATIDDVPDYYIRSSLQRVIQLLKRHRDIYYFRNKSLAEHRPASIIITTLAAKIANDAPTTDISELLSYIVEGLRNYAMLLHGGNPQFHYNGKICNFMEKKEEKWIISNPVDPDDNFADGWTDQTAKLFFSWIETVAMDLADTKIEKEKQYLTGLQTSFGKEFVNHTLLLQEPKSNYSQLVQTINRPTKPWGCGNND